MHNEVGLFFSFILFLVGASFLASTKEWVAFYRSLAEKSYSGILVAAYILPAGMVILSFHNVWDLSFALVVTLAGWGMAAKGVVYLMFPSLPQKWMPKEKTLRSHFLFSGAVLMLLGAASALSFYY